MISVQSLCREDSLVLVVHTALLIMCMYMYYTMYMYMFVVKFVSAIV